ncbi:LysE family translocator [Kordiimonas aquimaris]|uniref:LysE family translocator n=1 Tax=Kordiimonas aquimaris TaxID=707591 RepID=UPI0021CEA702|nr:LysE family translocator [Kordiimonas aquimaris]
MLPIDPLLYVLFILATVGFIFTPGPIVSLIVSETLRGSHSNGVAVAMGAQLVSIIYLAINFFGFASIAALPAIILDSIRYLGAAYLFYLAWTAYRHSPDLTNQTKTANKSQSIFLRSFRKSLLIASTSPKTILFFAAFFPQFVSDELPLANQLIVLSITFLIISFIMDMGWVFTANKARQFLKHKDKLAFTNKIAGSVLATGALLMLFING